MIQNVKMTDFVREYEPSRPVTFAASYHIPEQINLSCKKSKTDYENGKICGFKL